jgi:hypothetical protein
VGAVEPIETSLAPGNSAGHGNSQHASESASAKAAATELAEPGMVPGNGVGHGSEPDASNSAVAKASTAAEMTESGVVPGHSNSGEPSHPVSATAVGAVEPIETSLTPGNSAGHGNSQHAPQSAATSVAAQPAAAASETGSADQELGFHFNNQAPSTPAAVVELEVLNDPPVLLGRDVEPEAMLKISPTAVEDQAAGHVNNGQPHAVVLLPHDLLI